MTRPELLLLGTVVLFAIALALLIWAFRRSSRGGRGQTIENIAARLSQLENISHKVDELTSVFLIPGARGAIGETLLGQLLEDWLPRGAYDLQYQFRTGARADAVINLGQHLVAIDAKFPLEAVKRAFESEKSDGPLPADLRRAFQKHTNDIASKYIRPDEGTMSFALMYIPSERVYHYVFVENQQDLLREAQEKRVIPVSPGTLFLYLQTVAYGLKGLAVPEAQAEILSQLERLRRDFDDYLKAVGVADTHLKNLVKAFDESRLRLGRLDTDISTVHGKR